MQSGPDRKTGDARPIFVCQDLQIGDFKGE
jgi:hypothetical protein